MCDCTTVERNHGIRKGIWEYHIFVTYIASLSTTYLVGQALAQIIDSKFSLKLGHSFEKKSYIACLSTTHWIELDLKTCSTV